MKKKTVKFTSPPMLDTDIIKFQWQCACKEWNDFGEARCSKCNKPKPPGPRHAIKLKED